MTHILTTFHIKNDNFLHIILIYLFMFTYYTYYIHMFQSLIFIFPKLLNCIFFLKLIIYFRCVLYYLMTIFNVVNISECDNIIWKNIIFLQISFIPSVNFSQFMLSLSSVILLQFIYSNILFKLNRISLIRYFRYSIVIF